MVKQNQERTHISVFVKTKKKLEARSSHYQESMDSIINRLMFQADNGKVVAEQTKQDQEVENKL